jgi:alkanesulfonate monooxygenase SsuD/methylene tetrahydromethanopterin reductase-like flavin-dependent oxidoreductase (luciferase family)
MRFLSRVANSAIDFVSFADHVSFRNGEGYDGLIHATWALAAQRQLKVHLDIYQLPLRHPVVVARQIIDLIRLAGDRLLFGAGVGGDDRRELQACGVDPGSRGRRMDESLVVLRKLLHGDAVTIHGEFFELDNVSVLPRPASVVPILIGGRSDAAIRRTARFGDGWCAIWVSPGRFAAATSEIAERADALGRTVDWQHSISIWSGFNKSKERAREYLSAAMTEQYGLPFNTFERWSIVGSAEQGAEYALAYAAAGARHITFVAQAENHEAALDYTAEVRRLVRTEQPKLTSA